MLKSELDKLVIGKLETSPVDLSNPRYIIKINQLMLFGLVILVIQLKNPAYYSTKIREIKKEITDHGHGNKYITTQEFNKLTAENLLQD